MNRDKKVKSPQVILSVEVASLRYFSFSHNHTVTLIFLASAPALFFQTELQYVALSSFSKNSLLCGSQNKQ